LVEDVIVLVGVTDLFSAVEDLHADDSKDKEDEDEKVEKFYNYWHYLQECCKHTLDVVYYRDV
jgi:hypothetical protein